MNVDPRTYTSAFEVHFWPATGEIQVIHIPGFGNGPIVTQLRITGETGSAWLDETVTVFAQVYALAGNPEGGMIRHDADGTVSDVHVHNFARTVIRHAPITTVSV